MITQQSPFPSQNAYCSQKFNQINLKFTANNILHSTTMEPSKAPKFSRAINKGRYERNGTILSRLTLKLIKSKPRQAGT